MQWMALSNLWFALIIPAIVILYLLKRKVEDRLVPSTLLWQRALHHREAVRPWEKLRRNLLLLLQLLAALFLVLALLRLAVPVDGVSDEHTILVIEQSASMMAHEGETTRFQQAIQTATQLVEQLGSTQRVTLIEAGREPHVRVSKSGDRQELLQVLQTMSPQAGVSDTAAAMSLAAAISAEEPGSGVVWLGDGRPEGLDMATLPAINGPFRFQQMGSFRENTSLAVFVTQPTDDGMQGLIRLDNKGTQASRGSAVIYDSENNVLDASAFLVDAGESQTITFSSLPASPVYRAVIDPEQDGLQEDNERWSVPFTAGLGKAVLVSPEGNRFLHQALQTAGRLEVEIRPNVPGPDEEARDLWVFDGVVPDRLPEGNVLLIAPDRATDWLPYEGMRELNDPPQAVSPGHPLLSYVDWADVHVAQTSVLGEMTGMEALVRAGEQDLVRAGTIGGRRVVIVAFDLHDSDLPLRPAFPILMQNAWSWLAPVQTAPIASATPGELVDIALTPGAKSRVLIGPGGEQQVLEAEGTRYLFQVPASLGLYRLEEELDTGVQTRYFAVHVHEQETTITPLSLSVGTRQGTDEAESGEQGRLPSGSRDLTVWLAALALLIVFAEWRVYQRGY